jgi:AcrR family transcriptional regulator
VTDTTRERILDAAVDLFARQGFYTTSVREIAERVGLTKTAVLYHFPSKNEIVAALAEPLLTDMEAAVSAARRLPGADPRVRRWAVIEGLLDVWQSHRSLMRMQAQDMALASEGSVFERLRDAAVIAQSLIAGPGADLPARIRAVQAFAMLSDPVVVFADEPAGIVRTAVLAGVERLLGETAPRPSQKPRRGRPRTLTAEAVERAKRMYASGEHSPAQIAAALGVSRATVYRHVSHT